MLVFCLVFGSGIPRQNFPLDVAAETTLGQLKQLITKQVGEIVFKRVLFAGKSLADDERTLGEYHIQKESTVQVFAARPSADAAQEAEAKDGADADLPPPAALPLLTRQPTLKPVRYGDVLLIRLICAQDLVAADLDEGFDSSDPYVIFTLGQTSFRSSVVEKNLNPQWNELFGMFVAPDSGEDRLSVICMDRDVGKPDDPLGAFEVPLADIPRDRPLVSYFRLDGVPHGEIYLSLQLAPLSSPELVQVLRQLTQLERAWTEQDLDNAGITVPQLLGDQPWVPKAAGPGQDIVNPALAALAARLEDGSLTLSNQRTVSKVGRILVGQNAVATPDETGRGLWFTRLALPEPALRQWLEQVAPGTLKHLLYSVRSRSAEQGTPANAAFALFNTAEDALRVLLAVHRETSWRPLLPAEDAHAPAPGVSFGRGMVRAAILRHTDEAAGPEQGLLERAYGIRSDFFQVAGPQRPDSADQLPEEAQPQLQRQLSFDTSKDMDWAPALLNLTSAGNLEIYRSLSAEPIATLPLEDCLIQQTGAWSMQITAGYRDGDQDHRVAFFLRASSSNIKDEWADLIGAARAGRLGAQSAAAEEPAGNLVYRLDSGREGRLPDLLARFTALKTADDYHTIGEEFSAQDLSDLLSKAAYHEYLDAALQQLLKQSEQYVTCPSCTTTFELSAGDLALEQSFLDTAQGLDDRPLTPAAKKHCLEHRLTCRSCLKNFCTSCKVEPYHMGFTCAGWKRFQSQDKCRFCESTIEGGSDSGTCHDCEDGQDEADSDADEDEGEEESKSADEVDLLQALLEQRTDDQSTDLGNGFTLFRSIGSGGTQPPLDLTKGFALSAIASVPSDNFVLFNKVDGGLDNGGFLVGVVNGRLSAYFMTPDQPARWLMGPRVPVRTWSRLSVLYQQKKLMLTATYNSLVVYDLKTSVRRPEMVQYASDVDLYLTEPGDNPERFAIKSSVPPPLSGGTMLQLSNLDAGEVSPGLYGFAVDSDCWVYILRPTYMGHEPAWLRLGFEKTPYVLEAVRVAGPPSQGGSAPKRPTKLKLEVYRSRQILRAGERCMLDGADAPFNYAVVCGLPSRADGYAPAERVELANERADTDAADLYLALEGTVENLGRLGADLGSNPQQDLKERLQAEARAKLRSLLAAQLAKEQQLFVSTASDPAETGPLPRAGFHAGTWSEAASVKLDGASVAEYAEAASQRPVLLLNQAMGRGSYTWRFRIAALGVQSKSAVELLRSFGDDSAAAPSLLTVGFTSDFRDFTGDRRAAAPELLRSPSFTGYAMDGRVAVGGVLDGRDLKPPEPFSDVANEEARKLLQGLVADIRAGQDPEQLVWAVRAQIHEDFAPLVAGAVELAKAPPVVRPVAGDQLTLSLDLFSCSFKVSRGDELIVSGPVSLPAGRPVYPAVQLGAPGDRLELLGMEHETETIPPAVFHAARLEVDSETHKGPHTLGQVLALEGSFSVAARVVLAEEELEAESNSMVVFGQRSSGGAGFQLLAPTKHAGVRFWLAGHLYELGGSSLLKPKERHTLTVAVDVPEARVRAWIDGRSTGAGQAFAHGEAKTSAPEAPVCLGAWVDEKDADHAEGMLKGYASKASAWNVVLSDFQAMLVSKAGGSSGGGFDLRFDPDQCGGRLEDDDRHLKYKQGGNKSSALSLVPFLPNTGTYTWKVHVINSNGCSGIGVARKPILLDLHFNSHPNQQNCWMYYCGGGWYHGGRRVHIMSSVDNGRIICFELDTNAGIIRCGLEGEELKEVVNEGIQGEELYAYIELQTSEEESLLIPGGGAAGSSSAGGARPVELTAAADAWSDAAVLQSLPRPGWQSGAAHSLKENRQRTVLKPGQVVCETCCQPVVLNKGFVKALKKMQDMPDDKIEELLMDPELDFNAHGRLEWCCDNPWHPEKPKNKLWWPNEACWSCLNPTECDVGYCDGCHRAELAMQARVPWTRLADAGKSFSLSAFFQHQPVARGGSQADLRFPLVSCASSRGGRHWEFALMETAPADEDEEKQAAGPQVSHRVLGVRTGGAGPFRPIGSANLADGRWHSLVVSVDGPAGTVRIFVDGRSDGPASAWVPAPASDGGEDAGQVYVSFGVSVLPSGRPDVAGAAEQWRGEACSFAFWPDVPLTVSFAKQLDKQLRGKRPELAWEAPAAQSAVQFKTAQAKAVYVDGAEAQRVGLYANRQFTRDTGVHRWVVRPTGASVAVGLAKPGLAADLALDSQQVQTSAWLYRPDGVFSHRGGDLQLEPFAEQPDKVIAFELDSDTGEFKVGLLAIPELDGSRLCWDWSELNPVAFGVRDPVLPYANLGGAGDSVQFWAAPDAFPEDKVDSFETAVKHKLSYTAFPQVFAEQWAADPADDTSVEAADASHVIQDALARFAGSAAEAELAAKQTVFVRVSFEETAASWFWNPNARRVFRGEVGGKEADAVFDAEAGSVRIRDIEVAWTPETADGTVAVKRHSKDGEVSELQGTLQTELPLGRGGDKALYVVRLGRDQGINKLGSLTDLGLDGSSFSLEAWVRFAQIPAAGQDALLILGTDTNTGGGHLHLLLGAGGLLQLAMGQAAVITAAVPLEAARWYHVAVVYDSVLQAASILINGQTVAQGLRVDPLAAGSDPAASAAQFAIGAPKEGIHSPEMEVAGFRAWGRALDSSLLDRFAAQELAGPQVGLVRAWSLGFSCRSLRDLVSGGIWGRLPSQTLVPLKQTAAEFASALAEPLKKRESAADSAVGFQARGGVNCGGRGLSLREETVGSLVLAGPAARATNVGSGSFTLSCLVQTQANGKTLPLVTKRGAQANSYALQLEGGRPAIRFSGAARVAASATVNDGSWHHIAVVRERAAAAEDDEAKQELEQKEQEQGQEAAGGWTCSQCGLVNASSDQVCAVCLRDCPGRNAPLPLPYALRLNGGVLPQLAQLSEEGLLAARWQPQNFQQAAVLASEPLAGGLHRVRIQVRGGWNHGLIGLGVVHNAGARGPMDLATAVQNGDCPAVLATEGCFKVHGLELPAQVRSETKPAESPEALWVFELTFDALEGKLGFSRVDAADNKVSDIGSLALPELKNLKGWSFVAMIRNPKDGDLAEPENFGLRLLPGRYNPVLSMEQLQKLRKNAPQAPPIAWTPMEFHGDGGGNGALLEFVQPNVVKHLHSSFTTVWATNMPLAPGGVYEWEVIVHASTSNGGMHIGISTIEENIHRNYLASHSRGWSIYNGLSGHYHNGSSYGPGYNSKPFEAGQTVRVQLDFANPAKGVLRFWVNGEPSKHTFEDITPPAEGFLYPAASLYDREDRLEIVGLASVVVGNAVQEPMAGAPAAGFVRVYVDGRLSREMPDPQAALASFDLDNDGDFVVGPTGQLPAAFAATIRRLRLEKRARSAEEIRDEFQRLQYLLTANGEGIGSGPDQIDSMPKELVKKNSVSFDNVDIRNNLASFSLGRPGASAKDTKGVLHDAALAARVLPEAQQNRMRRSFRSFDSQRDRSRWYALPSSFSYDCFSMSFMLRIRRSPVFQPSTWQPPQYLGKVGLVSGSSQSAGNSYGFDLYVEKGILNLSAVGGKRSEPYPGPEIQDLNQWNLVEIKNVAGKLTFSVRSPGVAVETVELGFSRDSWRLLRLDRDLPPLEMRAFNDQNNIKIADVPGSLPDELWGSIMGLGSYNNRQNHDNPHIKVRVNRTCRVMVAFKQDPAQLDWVKEDGYVKTKLHLGIQENSNPSKWAIWSRKVEVLDDKPVEVCLGRPNGGYVPFFQMPEDAPAPPQTEEEVRAMCAGSAAFVVTHEDAKILGPEADADGARPVPTPLLFGRLKNNPDVSPLDGSMHGIVVASGRTMFHPIQCCDEAECLVKAQGCCVRVLPCGHPCMGCRDEAVCPPCLVADCDGRGPNGEAAPGQEEPVKLTQCADDQCQVCMDSLASAPCLVLSSCNHVYHRECLESRLKRGYPGKRITFAFMECPLCKQVVNHPSLNHLVEPYIQLRAKVQRMSLERLKYEGLDKSPRLQREGDAFFNDPEGFAMQHFSFYRCSGCQDPYFAGAANCGPADDQDDANNEELLCVKCQGVDSVESCKTHGTEWLSFKCRFCCKVSVWHCWNKCHFCEPCHNSFSQYVTYEGVNTKKLWEYTQCPGIRERMDTIKATYPQAEWESRMAKIIADPARCPLGVRHLPNGIEYGLGCGLCEPNKPEEAESEAEVDPAVAFRTLQAVEGVNATGNRFQLLPQPVPEEQKEAPAVATGDQPGAEWCLARSSGPVAMKPASEEQQRQIVIHKLAQLEDAAAAAAQESQAEVCLPESLNDQFSVVSYTGAREDADPAVDIANILKSDPSLVHCSRPGQAFDLVLRWEGPGEFALNRLVMEAAGPAQFCDSPARKVLAFVSTEEPKPELYAEHYPEAWGRAQWNALQLGAPAGAAAGTPTPVLFVQTDPHSYTGEAVLPNGQLGRQLPPVTGRYLHLRFLQSHFGQGIDISSIDVQGAVAPADGANPNFPFQLNTGYRGMAEGVSRDAPVDVVVLAVPLPQAAPASGKPEAYATEYVVGLEIEDPAEEEAEEKKESEDDQDAQPLLRYAFASSGHKIEVLPAAGSRGVPVAQLAGAEAYGAGAWGVGDQIQVILDHNSHTVEYRVNGNPSGPAFFLPSDREIKLRLGVGLRCRPTAAPAAGKAPLADLGSVLVSRSNLPLGTSDQFFNFRAGRSRLPANVRLSPLLQNFGGNAADLSQLYVPLGEVKDAAKVEVPYYPSAWCPAVNIGSEFRLEANGAKFVKLDHDPDTSVAVIGSDQGFFEAETRHTWVFKVVRKGDEMWMGLVQGAPHGAVVLDGSPYESWYDEYIVNEEREGWFYYDGSRDYRSRVMACGEEKNADAEAWEDGDTLRLVLDLMDAKRPVVRFYKDDDLQGELELPEASKEKGYFPVFIADYADDCVEILSYEVEREGAALERLREQESAELKEREEEEAKVAAAAAAEQAKLAPVAASAQDPSPKALKLDEGMALEFNQFFGHEAPAAASVLEDVRSAAEDEAEEREARHALRCWTIVADVRLGSRPKSWLNFLQTRPVGEQDWLSVDSADAEARAAFEAQVAAELAQAAEVIKASEEAVAVAHIPQEWECGRCTFINEPVAESCGICEGPRPEPQAPKPAVSAGSSALSSNWSPVGVLQISPLGKFGNEDAPDRNVRAGPASLLFDQWIRVVVTADLVGQKALKVFVNGSLACTLQADEDSGFRLRSKFALFAGPMSHRLAAGASAQVAGVRVFPRTLNSVEVSDLGSPNRPLSRWAQFDFNHGGVLGSMHLSSVGDFAYAAGGRPTANALFGFNVDPYYGFHSFQAVAALRSGDDASRVAMPDDSIARLAADGSDQVAQPRKQVLPSRLEWLAHATYNGALWVYGGMDARTSQPVADLMYLPEGPDAGWEKVFRSADAPWPPALARHSMAVLGDNLFVWGGLTPTKPGSDSYSLNKQLWRFHVPTQSWQQLRLGAGLANDPPFWGGVFVATGADRWAPRPEDKQKPAGYLGSLWIFGGSDSSANGVDRNDSPSDNRHVYELRICQPADAPASAAGAAPALAVFAVQHAAAAESLCYIGGALGEDGFYVAGGARSSYSVQADARKFVFDSHSWESARAEAPFSVQEVASHIMHGSLHDGQVLLFVGGYNNDSPLGYVSRSRALLQPKSHVVW